MNEKKRDVILDDIRACAMIWVMVVHSLYWSGLFREPPALVLKSFFLIEMPLFFFVIGATSRLTAHKSSYANFIVKRWRGILIPYWIYAAFAVATTIAFLATLQTFPNLNGLASNDADIPKLSTSVIGKATVSWLIPHKIKTATVPYLTSALWFVIIYLICVVFIPPILKGRRSRPLATFGVLATTFAVASNDAVHTCIHTYIHKLQIQTTSFYLIWIYIGSFYPEIKKFYNDARKRFYFGTSTLLVLSGATIILLKVFCGYSLDMQSNKFPPNVMFLAYSFAATAFLASAVRPIFALLKRLKQFAPIDWTLNRYSRYSMTIYFFHPFVFLSGRIIQETALKFLKIDLSDVAFLAYWLVVSIVGGAVVSVVFGWTQKVDATIVRLFTRSSIKK